MTAEIAIMNKEAIALAADSAVTMTGSTGEKIFTSANKLFTLSKYHPVGIMVYGSAIFMGVPWETIIKTYRKRLGKKKCDTLKRYAADFISFLDNGNPLFPGPVQEEYVHASIRGYFSFLKRAIEEKVRSIIDEQGEITDREIEQITSATITEDYEKWRRAPNIPSIPKTHSDEILRKHSTVIHAAIKDVFENLPISKRDSTRLSKIATSLFSKFPEHIQKGDISGVVVAGFGDQDTFPSVYSFHVEGIANNRLKYVEYSSGEINFDTSALIIAFAQREMVATFMEGVNPFYRDVEESYLSQIFNEYAGMVAERVPGCNEQQKERLKQDLIVIGQGIAKEHQEKLREHRQQRYVGPVTAVVSMLPKDELAAMAESLVSLTSFKRKVTMEQETVGGPIDVAVISKGDGLVWIKRKHYFRAELNPQFFANYYRED